MISEATQSNGYFHLVFKGHRIQSLRVDPTGLGSYGMDTVAEGGAFGPFEEIDLAGNRLILTPQEGTAHWDTPFHRKGYYDVDLHLNYPQADTTAGAFPLVLPFQKLISSTGQTTFIEHFKRLPLSEEERHDSSGKVEAGKPYWIVINLARGEKLLFQGDVTQTWDLQLTAPGEESLEYILFDNALRFAIDTKGVPLELEVLPRGLVRVPGEGIEQPVVEMKPDFAVTYHPTEKQTSGNHQISDLIQMGIFWAPRITAPGEWGLPAVETHSLDDPRALYLEILRRDLISGTALIGYDRFEHFGYRFQWGRYPDYGAGGLLNVPPDNAPYDMRFLHLNATWILALATYVQATGDLSILETKHAYWVGTDGKETQPLVGKKAEGRAFLLPAGDVRLDKKIPEKVHTLGQPFRATQPFKRVDVRLGTESDKEDASGRIWLASSPDGEPLAESEFTLQKANPPQTVSLELDKEYGPGDYFVGVQDNDSGKRYFGPGIFWVADLDSQEDAPPATSGPFQGNLFDRMKLLFSFLYEHTGAKRENLSYYQDDREFNLPQQKSGRIDSMQNSFWECLGGGYDAFAALWYNAACTAMADISQKRGQTEEAARYRELRRLADEAYNEKFWTTVEENGRTFSRYTGVVDWDGKSWDFGFTYYNLEAAHRGIASPTQAREILWWLDHGQWTADNQTWNDHIYSIWDIAAPFNTINNTTWIGITGTLPYREVLTNGGTRMDIAARDLTVRSKYLSIDNMHERMKRVLGRFSSPDRLTGGRTHDDPGGRGRWHFGTPNVDRADIEGFREIFPQNGVLATAIVQAYLGWEYTGEGLRLRPRVPSDMEKYSFENIGYSGALLDFHVQAERETVDLSEGQQESENRMTFRASDPFNRVGLQCRIRPFLNRSNSEISLSLQRKSETGIWEEVAVNWYNQVQDEDWVWVTAEEMLAPDKAYAIEVSHLSAPEGEELSLVRNEDDRLVCRLESEVTRLEIQTDLAPEADFELQREPGDDPAEGLSTVMAPGESVLLRKVKP